MTLVVSIGSTILGGSLLGAGAAGTGVLAGATLSGVASGLGTGAAIAAGTVGAGTLAGAGMAINEMTKGPPASTPNVPTLAPGLSPGMSAAEAVSPAAASPAASPMAGLGSIGQEQKAASGGLMMARGGQVPVRDGAYIIPADVVSALGNGSSKAGAEFLRRLMEEVKSQGVKRHGLGAVKRDAA